MEETAGEREKGKETDGAGNVVYRTIVSHCPPLRCVTILPLRLRRSHFPLASSPILILSFPVCQFVKAPHHYCQKSRRGTNTKAARTMSHIQARTLVHVAHSCVERERLFFFFLPLRLGSDTRRQACPTGIPRETDKQCELRRTGDFDFPVRHF